MISEFPALQIPDSLTRLCGLNLKNNRSSFSEISEIIDKDKFLNLFVKQAFSEYLKKGGILGMLTALGWKGFRNRLAEAYIYHARFGRFPKYIEVDEVNYVIDFEKRYDFLFVESNSRVFMLGLYLKLCEIKNEISDEVHFEEEFISISSEIDEILIKGRSKSINPDWLIVLVWCFHALYGEQKASELLLRTKGKMNRVLQEIPIEDYESIIESLLRYGHAVNDSQFFTEEKV